MRTAVANAILVIALASSLTAWSVAATASPQDDKRKVNSQLSQAHNDLDESSAALVKTSNALTAAQAKLTSAQGNLAKVRGQLATARADDTAAALRTHGSRRRTRIRRHRGHRGSGRRRPAALGDRPVRERDLSELRDRLDLGRGRKPEHRRSPLRHADHLLCC